MKFLLILLKSVNKSSEQITKLQDDEYNMDMPSGKGCLAFKTMPDSPRNQNFMVIHSFW